MEWLWSFFSRKGESGFGSRSTTEQVTHGIDASNITAVITGATSGIGMETARVLALRGATVIIAAISQELGEEAKEKIVEQVADAKVEAMERLRQIIRCRFPLLKQTPQPSHKQCRQDGIELQFAINYIGHFLLTNLLLEKMKATAQESGIEGRIVIVASAGHSRTYKSSIRFENINNPSGYGRFQSYGQSKLAAILHARELARRLQEEEAKVTANSPHPGAIPTNIALLAPLTFIFSPFLKTVQQGAATTCYLALHPNMEGVSGKYYSDCNCKEDQPTAYGRDADLARSSVKKLQAQSLHRNSFQSNNRLITGHERALHRELNQI